MILSDVCLSVCSVHRV